jgi:isopentenyl diphosphate isomerase/L-lactate dehydrogenase-like FMN-dependent dehydrogenase
VALAACGTPGVERMLDMSQRELVGAAVTAGRSTVASIDKSLVKATFTQGLSSLDKVIGE